MLGELSNLLQRTGLGDEAKAQATSAFIYALTGSAPRIDRGTDNHGAFVKVTPTPEQAETLRANLENWLSKSPSGFRLDLKGIWGPMLMKRAAPWAIGIGVLGFLGGKSI